MRILFIPAALILGGMFAATLTSIGGAPPHRDLTLHMPPQHATYKGPCTEQARTWYLQTGQSDMLALAAAQTALTNQVGGSFAGLEHAANQLSAVTATAASDPPPVCVDKAGAWAAMTKASQQEATDLYLNDEEDGTVATSTVALQLRVLKSELPAWWFATIRYHKPKPLPNPNATSTTKAGN
jgi:hypothetical protein